MLDPRAGLRCAADAEAEVKTRADGHDAATHGTEDGDEALQGERGK